MAKKPSFSPPAPNLVGRADPLVVKAFQDLTTRISELHSRVDSLPPPQKIDYPSIARALSLSGSSPLSLQGLIGTLSNPQRAFVTNLSANPPNGSILNQPGTITLINGILNYYGIKPGTAPTWNPTGAVGVTLSDTHANRLASYAPGTLPLGATFWETDRKVLYLNLGTYGSSTWTYILGEMQDTLTNLPTDLTTADKGFLFFVSDYAHQLQWTGAAWGWGPGDSRDAGQGPTFFEIDPSPTTGWQLYTGALVTYLKSDGTVGSVTLPNLSGASPTQVYLKTGDTPSGPNAAVSPTSSGGTLSTESATHTHAISLTSTTESVAHTHTLSGITLSTESASHNHTLSGTVFGTESVSHTHTFAATTNAQPYSSGTPVVVPLSLSTESALHLHSNTGGTNTESTTHTHTVSGGSLGTESALHSHDLVGGTSTETSTHTHTLSGITFSSPGEPQNLVRRAWFRQ